VLLLITDKLFSFAETSGNTPQPRSVALNIPKKADCDLQRRLVHGPTGFMLQDRAAEMKFYIVAFGVDYRNEISSVSRAFSADHLFYHDS
jgi:hypothetical protein